VLAVLGLGGVAMTILGNMLPGGADTYADSAPANLGSTPHEAARDGLPTVAETGVDYTSENLRDQIRDLVSGSTVARAQGDGAGPSPTPDAGSGTGPGPDQKQAQDLSSPAFLSRPEALRGCLDAIGARNEKPIAVDLARFSGREATVIVLPGRDGGYQVWVVGRDCRPGADGTIYYGVVSP